MRWGDRSPGTAWSPAPMESVDRWPLASPDTQIPGGSRPAGAAVRRRVRGAGPLTRGPYAAGHTALARADWWNTLRADRCLRGYSGGNWMVTFSRPPGAPGVCRGGRALVRPFQLYQVTSWLLRELWAAGDWRLPLSGGASPGGRNRDIWLILPVVICLSQRLSHACLSTHGRYSETANGSLNQLWFLWSLLSRSLDNCGNSRANTCRRAPTSGDACIYQTKTNPGSPGGFGDSR